MDKENRKLIQKLSGTIASRILKCIFVSDCKDYIVHLMNKVFANEQFV